MTPSGSSWWLGWMSMKRNFVNGTVCPLPLQELEACGSSGDEGVHIYYPQPGDYSAQQPEGLLGYQSHHQPAILPVSFFPGITFSRSSELSMLVILRVPPSDQRYNRCWTSSVQPSKLHIPLASRLHLTSLSSAYAHESAFSSTSKGSQIRRE